MPRELDRAEQIGQGLLKQYRKKLWRPFMHAIRDYQLIQAGDRIAVCISGGKDSMLMARLMLELQKHSEVPFENVYLVMDPGYAPENRAKIEENARVMGVPVTIFESDVFDASAAASRNPCYLCARMRRGCLYGKARELGCNKIALGHHFDDVIVTTVMAMFYGSQLQAMPPKLHAKNFPGMELIRPLYQVREEDIIDWAQAEGLTFIQCACKLTRAETHADGTLVSKRREVKELLHTLRETNPDIEKSIFNAIHKCSVDTMPGFRWHGHDYSLLDVYDGAAPFDDMD